MFAGVGLQEQDKHGEHNISDVGTQAKPSTTGAVNGQAKCGTCEKIDSVFKKKLQSV